VELSNRPHHYTGCHRGGTALARIRKAVAKVFGFDFVVAQGIWFGFYAIMFCIGLITL
jgi:hypothetical protein